MIPQKKLVLLHFMAVSRSICLSCAAITLSFASTSAMFAVSSRRSASFSACNALIAVRDASTSPSALSSIFMRSSWLASTVVRVGTAEAFGDCADVAIVVAAITTASIIKFLK